MMQDILATLRYEFDAEENSFLLKMRCNLEWDARAFEILIDAMQAYLESDRDKEHIDRWIAQGFWFANHYVKYWTSHPAFPKQLPESYYECAYQRLYDLAYWFFAGESPYESGTLPPFAET